MKVFVIRYGEISLKGLNRNEFENRLVENLRLQLKDFKVKVTKARGRVYVIQLDDSVDFSNISERLEKVFGIISFSLADVVEVDMDEIKHAVMAICEPRKKEPIKFRIATNRAEKKLKPSSEIDREIGQFVVDNFGWKVDLKNYKINICVEIADKAYIYTESTAGLGGLPVGSSGKVLCLMQGENAILSCFLMMKRGCEIIPFVFDCDMGSDRGNASNGDLVNQLITRLQHYSPKKLSLNRFSEQDLVSFMDRKKVEAVVVPDVLDEYNALDREDSIFTLRPLVGFSQKEVDEKIKQI